MNNKKTKIATHLNNSLELRQFLIAIMLDLRAGKVQPNEARAHALLARSILDTARLEIITAARGLQHFEPIDLTSPVSKKEEEAKETV